MALNQKHRTGIWLATIFSIAGLYFVFTTIPRISLRSGLPRLNWRYLGISFLFLLVVWLAKSYRMRLIGNGMGAHIKLRRYFEIYMATCFIAHVTPFNSGGTPLQIYLLHGQGVTLGKASAITVVDLGFNTLIFLALALVTIIHRGAPALMSPMPTRIILPHQSKTWLLHGPGAGIILIIIIILIVAFFLRFWQRLAGRPDLKDKTGKGTAPRITNWVYSFLQRKHWLENFRREYALFKEGLHALASQKPARVYAGILVTVIYWFSYLSLAPLIIGALGRPVSFTGPVSFTSLMGEQLLFNLVQIFIPTPGGSGGSELIMAYLFRKITGPADIGWFVLLWKIYTFFSTLIIGGYHFIRLALDSGKNP
ncbi:MAG: flippase-like domain-containing protein [Firmicutes bacterium]|nr:flippase-like domain-containing protein [Bacillota bacterium]